MTRNDWRQIVATGLLAVLVAGCGKYGPPEPYPPGYSAPDAEEQSEDEEERR